jgi:hypothetical protein
MGAKGLTVLHDVSDNAELVEVAASAFSSKRFFEGDLTTVMTVQT